MSGSSSASSDDEQDPSNDGVQKTQRKKSSKRRSLDQQRRISLSKMREEKKEARLQKLHSQQHESEENHTNNNNINSDVTEKPQTTVTVNSESQPIDIPVRHGKHRLARNGKISGGYEQFSMSLLTVPMPKDYGEPSSDDLSSEWDSDSVNDTNKTNGTANKEPKVRLTIYSHQL